MVKMGYSEDEIFAVLNESNQARKRRQILAKVTETDAAYRLREMKGLRVREKLATWRRMNGFDRVVDARIIGFIVLVRFHQRLNNSLRVCGPICKN